MLLTLVFLLQLTQLHSLLKSSLWWFGKLLPPVSGKSTSMKTWKTEWTKAWEGTAMGWVKWKALSHQAITGLQQRQPKSHLWVLAEIETLRMLFIRSKRSCALLWLESREPDFSNLWKKDQVSHTPSPLTPAAGNRSDARQTEMHLRRWEVDNGTWQQCEVLLLTQLTLQAVTHNITRHEFQIRQFLIRRFPLPSQILIF